MYNRDKALKNVKENVKNCSDVKENEDHERLDDQSFKNLRSGILWDIGSGTGIVPERFDSQRF